MSQTIPSGQPEPMKPGEYTPLSQNQAVTFAFQKIAPPSNIYINRDDQLLFTAFLLSGTNIVFTLRARLLLVEGRIVTIERASTALSNNGQFSTVIPLAEGYLLSASVTVALQTQSGNAYARLNIVRGGSSEAFSGLQLMGGYLTSRHPLTWPGSEIRLPQDGPGFISDTFVGSITAGTDFTATFSNRARVISFQATLTTSVAVANRNVQLQLVDAATTQPVFTSQVNATIPASTAATVVGSTVFSPAALIATLVMAPLPINFVGDNFTVKTVTQNLQAGDQWTNISIFTEQWLSQQTA